MPGFTRGLDFAGGLAFVGLSQVRESAVFSGIPITERLAEHERTCGVCGKSLVSVHFSLKNEPTPTKRPQEKTTYQGTGMFWRALN